MDRKRIEWLLKAKVTKMVPFHKHYLVYTSDHKKWVLKKGKNQEHLRWWLSIDQELRDRGFNDMPAFYTDGSKYMVTPWIQGKVGTYRDPEQAIRLIRHLAFFHQAGQQLNTPPKQEVAFLFFDRLYHRLKQFYQLLRRVDSIPGKLGQLLKQYGPQFYTDGYRVWRKLRQLPLQDYVLWERSHRRLAHRDLASHNWIVDEERIWLIDFDLADYDSQLGDIWQIVTRIMAEHPESKTIDQELLKSYESIRPLNEFEKNMLRLLVYFPNEFMRESIGLAKKHQGYSFSSTFPYLERMAVNRYRKTLKYRSTW